MTISPMVRLLLVLGVALALPLTVEAFLLGGHVTPEQGLRHAAAIAGLGEHSHTRANGAEHPHQGGALTQSDAPAALAATPSADAGPALSAQPPTPFSGGWLALATALLVLHALSARRRGRGPAALAPPGCSLALAPPPPRSHA